MRKILNVLFLCLVIIKLNSAEYITCKESDEWEKRIDIYAIPYDSNQPGHQIWFKLGSKNTEIGEYNALWSSGVVRESLGKGSHTTLSGMYLGGNVIEIVEDEDSKILISLFSKSGEISFTSGRVIKFKIIDRTETIENSNISLPQTSK